VATPQPRLSSGIITRGWIWRRGGYW
jgi:hypothetical protein